MEPHHAASIQNLIAEFRKDPNVLALVLGGSLAHGFARTDSDIDVAIVLTPDAFARQKAMERVARFAAQLLGWRWYYSEALRPACRIDGMSALPTTTNYQGTPRRHLNERGEFRAEGDIAKP